MTNSKMCLVADIKLSWWLRYLYLPGLVFFSKICCYFNLEIEPDWDLIEKAIKKGIKLKNMRTKKC